RIMDVHAIGHVDHGEVAGIHAGHGNGGATGNHHAAGAVMRAAGTVIHRQATAVHDGVAGGHAGHVQVVGQVEGQPVVRAVVGLRDLDVVVGVAEVHAVARLHLAWRGSAIGAHVPA